MLKLLKAALCAGTTALACTQASAVTIHKTSVPDLIRIDGMIEHGDDAFLRDVLDQRAAEGLKTTIVGLNSSGGYVAPAYEMAKLIRERSMTTVVGSKGECASACVLMFAAGTQRIIFAGAKIGVHGVAKNGTGQEEGHAVESYAGTIVTARILRDFGAPPAVAGLLVTTPPDQIAWLTRADMGDWVVESEAPAAEQPKPAPQAPQTSSDEPVVMTCQGAQGSYVVRWYRTALQVNERWYVIDKGHIHSKTQAAVLNGKTKYGVFAAVFGGPRPRMEFDNGREKVTDFCG